jgi:hypothetical protein
MTERFYLDAYGVDDEAVRLGFAWLVETAAAAGHSEAVLAMPAVGNIESLGRSLGQATADALRKNREIQAGGVKVLVTTERDRYACSERVTLAVWADDEQLAKIEAAKPSALCVIPWGNDIGKWLANYLPTEMRSGRQADSKPEPSATVVEALKSLTAVANTGTGVNHPSDRDSAISLFAILQENGERFDPDEVRVWAVNHGWSPQGAEQLEGVARQTLEGRRLRASGRQMWKDNVIEIWRQDAASADPTA